MRAVLRWFAERTTLRPRRITLTAWWLLWLFSPAINGFTRRHYWLIVTVDAWALVALLVLAATLGVQIWRKGRDVRRRKRDHRPAN